MCRMRIGFHQRKAQSPIERRRIPVGSAGFDESVDEPVRSPAHALIEYQHGLVVAGIAEHARFPIEYEAGGFDVPLREFLVDSVKLLCGSPPRSRHCRMVDDREDSTRLEGASDLREEEIAIDLRVFGLDSDT